MTSHCGAEPISRLWAGSLGFPYLQSFDDLVESGAIAAIDKVCAACLSAGVAVGVSTGDATTAMEIMSAARFRSFRHSRLAGLRFRLGPVG